MAASYRPLSQTPESHLPGLPPQASLFAPALLPRQLPTYKAGPEDELHARWAAPPPSSAALH